MYFKGLRDSIRVDQKSDSGGVVKCVRNSKGVRAHRSLILNDEANLSLTHGRLSVASNKLCYSYETERLRLIQEFSRTHYQTSMLSAEILSQAKEPLKRPSDDYLDSIVDSICRQWNVEDFLNVEDVSALVSAFQHNLNSAFVLEQRIAINMLLLKLLIADADYLELEPDFIESLKLSIVYADLKYKKCQNGVQALLSHIAYAPDRKLFVLDTPSSLERRIKHPHVVGRVVTCNPYGSTNQSLVSVIINKGYRGKSERGQFSFRFLTDKPSLYDLRYPKSDAYRNRAKLRGRDQVVGNCGVIAIKEALQVALAFQDEGFKKNFLNRSLKLMPFSFVADASLKRHFKSLYVFHGKDKSRVQDVLSALLVKKMREKAGDNVEFCRQVIRLEEINCARWHYKFNRKKTGINGGGKLQYQNMAHSEAHLSAINSEPEKERLSDLKTILTRGPGLLNYVGLLKPNHRDGENVLSVLSKIWNLKVGTFDEKLNLTKALIDNSLTGILPYEKKLEFVGRLLTCEGFSLKDVGLEEHVKPLIRKHAMQISLDDLFLKKDVFLSSHQVLFRLINALVKEGDVGYAFAIMNKFFERYSALTQDNRDLSGLSSFTIMGRDNRCLASAFRAFRSNLFKDQNLIVALKEALATVENVGSLNDHARLIKHLAVESENYHQGVERALELKVEVVKEKKGVSSVTCWSWGSAMLRAGENKLRHSKNTERLDGLFGIAYAMGHLGCSEEELCDKSGFSEVLGQCLAERDGHEFMTALALCHGGPAAKSVLRSLESSALIRKLIEEYRKGDSWCQSNILESLDYLSDTAKAEFNSLL